MLCLTTSLIKDSWADALRFRVHCIYVGHCFRFGGQSRFSSLLSRISDNFGSTFIKDLSNFICFRFANSCFALYANYHLHHNRRCDWPPVLSWLSTRFIMETLFWGGCSLILPTWFRLVLFRRFDSCLSSRFAARGDCAVRCSIWSLLEMINFLIYWWRKSGEKAWKMVPKIKFVLRLRPLLLVSLWCCCSLLVWTHSLLRLLASPFWIAQRLQQMNVEMDSAFSWSISSW